MGWVGVLIEVICLRLVRRWPVDIFGDCGGRGSFFFLSSNFLFWFYVCDLRRGDLNALSCGDWGICVFEAGPVVASGGF